MRLNWQKRISMSYADSRRLLWSMRCAFYLSLRVSGYCIVNLTGIQCSFIHCASLYSFQTERSRRVQKGSWSTAEVDESHPPIAAAAFACSVHRSSLTPNKMSHRIFANAPTSPSAPIIGNRVYPSGRYKKLIQPTPPIFPSTPRIEGRKVDLIIS